MSIKYFAIFGVTVAAALAWAPLTIQANAHGSGFKMPFRKALAAA